jgi:hypothetical protein
VSAKQDWSFRKEAEPKLVGITLAGDGSRIELGSW